MRRSVNLRRCRTEAAANAVVEVLESRRLFTAWTTAPTILQVSDGVKNGTSFSVNGGGLDSSAVVAVAPVATGPVFEADMNGSGTGTGGSGNLVALGGTGKLSTATGVTNTITGTSPISANSGNYLNSAVTAGTPSGQTVATFTPAAISNSWDALTGTTTVGGVSYTTLNGGFDLFVRPNTTVSTDISWFRPIDLSNISGTTGMRIILGGGSSNSFQFELKTGGNALSSSVGSTETNDSFGLSGGLTNLGNPFTNGAIEHIGVTFSTNNLTGQITMKVFALAGSGAINTNSSTNLLGMQSFYALASVVGTTPLPTGSWSMTDRYSNTTSTSVDYDTPRLYSTTPGSFSTGPGFDADFNDAADVATVGGTGTLGSGTGVTDKVTGATPFTARSSNYLDSLTAANTPSPQTVATFTPTNASNSWNAITGSMTVGGTSYTTLNGGFDLFVQPKISPSGNLSWFRPIDISNISGTSGMRLILGGGSTNQLQLQVITGGTALGTSAGTFTANTTLSLSGGSLAYVTSPFSGTSIVHLGITFSTDATGMITIKLFAVTGTGSIDTTSSTNLIGSQSFFASAAIIGSALPTGSWSMTDRYSTTSATTDIAYDSVRLYNTLQTSFAGLSPSATPPAGAVYPQILQTDSNESIYTVAEMPAGSPAGDYDVWVENSYGWSLPALMNAPRPISISDYQAYAGADIEVVGKNMTGVEFGGTSAPQVRLNDGNGNIVMQPLPTLMPAPGSHGRRL